jgi:hypothetical protein
MNPSSIFVSNGLLPKRPTALTFAANFAGETTIQLNSSPNQSGQGIIASYAIVDATTCTQDCTLFYAGVDYVIKSGTTSGFPLLATDNPAAYITSTGTGVANIAFTDAVGIPAFTLEGTGQTATELLQQITGSAPGGTGATTFAWQYVTGNTQSAVPVFAADTYVAVGNVGASGSTIWTAPANQQIVVKRGLITIADANQSAAGNIQVGLKAGANLFWVANIYVPGGSNGIEAQFPLDFAEGLALGVGNNITLYLSSALTSGQIGATIYGTTLA